MPVLSKWALCRTGYFSSKTKNHCSRRSCIRGCDVCFGWPSSCRSLGTMAHFYCSHSTRHSWLRPNLLSSNTHTHTHQKTLQPSNSVYNQWKRKQVSLLVFAVTKQTCYPEAITKLKRNESAFFPNRLLPCHQKEAGFFIKAVQLFGMNCEWRPCSWSPYLREDCISVRNLLNRHMTWRRNKSLLTDIIPLLTAASLSSVCVRARARITASILSKLSAPVPVATEQTSALFWCFCVRTSIYLFM